MMTQDCPSKKKIIIIIIIQEQTHRENSQRILY